MIDPALRTDVLVKAVGTQSVSTQEGYLTDVHRAAAVLGELLGHSPCASDFMALDTAALEKLVEVWQQHDVAASTIRRRLVSVRKYVRQLALELGLSGPVLTAQFPRMAVPAVRLQSAPDLDDLRIAIERSQTWVNARDLSLMAIVACHGLALCEAERLNWNSVTNGTLIVERPSGLRFLTIDPLGLLSLERYAAALPSKMSQVAPLWLNQDGERMSRRMLQLGMQRVRKSLGWPTEAVAGLFRRRRIIQLAESGLPLPDIAMVMGIGVETVAHHLRR